MALFPKEIAHNWKIRVRVPSYLPICIVIVKEVGLEVAIF